MKAQAQAVTAVMITGIVVGSVATAYIWGLPLLEKQQSQSNIQSIEENTVGFYERIAQVSRSGEGTTSSFGLTDGIPNSDTARIEVNEKQDYIDFRIRAKNPPYPFDAWTVIRGNNRDNTSIGTGEYARRGSNIPGIVAVRAAGAPGSSLLTYRIDFRNLIESTSSGKRLYRINISTAGETTSTGDIEVFISNQGEGELGSDTVTLSSGEEVPRINTNIRLSFE